MKSILTNLLDLLDLLLFLGAVLGLAWLLPTWVLLGIVIILQLLQIIDTTTANRTDHDQEAQ